METNCGHLAYKYDFEYLEDKLITLAQALKSMIDDEAKVPDWNKREKSKQVMVEMQLSSRVSQQISD